MGFIKTLIKSVSDVKNSKEKEVRKMTKKIVILSLMAMLTIGLSLGDANAATQYTPIGTPVAVTATGTLTGSVTNMAMSIVSQSTGTPASNVSFATINSTDLTNSGEALAITGGTTDVDARIIVYTDNASYFSAPNNDPAIESGTGRPTGVDGAGMPGAMTPGYVAPLIWGLTSNADWAPNTNPTYGAFSIANLNAGIGCTYTTDLRHAYDFVTASLVAGINATLPVTTYTIDQIDTMTLYKTDTTAGPTNGASEGSIGFPKLVPTLFGESLWSTSNVSTRKLIREALYRNIATIAYGIRSPNPSDSAETGYYICQTPNLSTASGADNVRAKLAKYGAGATDAYLYVPIGADFTTKPAQEYTTAKLTVAMVKY